MGAGTIPSDFTISGSVGNRAWAAQLFPRDGQLGWGQSISVHITAPTCSDDLASTCTCSPSIP